MLFYYLLICKWGKIVYLAIACLLMNVKLMSYSLIRELIYIEIRDCPGGLFPIARNFLGDCIDRNIKFCDPIQKISKAIGVFYKL